MYKLEEVQKYLEELLTKERVKQCYSQITNPQQRVNSDDKKWVACSTEHEVESVYVGLVDIAGSSTKEKVIDAIKKTCKQFDKVTHKHRIPFYVLVLDKLLPVQKTK